MSEDGSFYYYWLGWYDFGLSIDSYPSNIVTKNGSAATSTNAMTFYDANGGEVPVVCYASDVFGVADSGSIYFLIEAFPGVYRTGDMTWAKTGGAAAQAAPRRTAPAMLSSVVLR